ncbi:MAG TPA: hypothetical protein VFN25_15125 [Dokdonella sp.]|uniref:hypothetical protein n=1 Tax=Dokdonella sp. TaxID=2291710 RepID=UPI002D7E3EB6|nr:hypothetical protein [Dokdonella sp.]HET9034222.1 hypothetical protein [Dokdonella sp.]
MSQPPELLPFEGEWGSYEDVLYDAFLTSFVRADIRFKGWRIKAQYRPDTRGKGFSFWHVISEAPSRENRNENDRIPALSRCARIRWIAWTIEQANLGMDGFSWWENRRGRETGVVIWAERWDFAVILSKRNEFYLLKTAYCDLQSHRRRSFERERGAFWKAQKG